MKHWPTLFNYCISLQHETCPIVGTKLLIVLLYDTFDAVYNDYIIVFYYIIKRATL